MSKSLTDPWWVKKGLPGPPTLNEADSQAKRVKERNDDFEKALEASIFLSEFITKYELEGTWDFQDVLDELDTFIINLMDENEN